ncbi:MAG TPA: hypothetical protein VLC91_11590, partial [Spongiibacteraceae bacterium]|nr:hypothetical protein [Spongiibacteraceae bacterium]
TELANWADTIDRLPDLLRQAGTDDSIIEDRVLSIEGQAEMLRDARPRFLFITAKGEDAS